MIASAHRIIYTLMLLGGALYFARARDFCVESPLRMEPVHAVFARFMSLFLTAAAAASLCLKIPDIAFWATAVLWLSLTCNGLIGNIHCFGWEYQGEVFPRVFRLRIAAGFLMMAFDVAMTGLLGGI